MTGWVQSEDFRLAAAATLTDVSFWAFDDPGNYQGRVDWKIWSDNAGSPDIILHSGTVTPTGTSYPAAECCGFTQGLEFDFSVGSIALAGNTVYHLSLTATSSSGLYWATSAANSTGLGISWNVTNDWQTTAFQHAFELFDNSSVPEPATCGLFGAGLLAIGFVRRRLQ